MEQLLVLEIHLSSLELALDQVYKLHSRYQLVRILQYLNCNTVFRAIFVFKNFRFFLETVDLNIFPSNIFGFASHYY